MDKDQADTALPSRCQWQEKDEPSSSWRLQDANWCQAYRGRGRKRFFLDSKFRTVRLE